jgi:hypothetical protein
MTKLQTIHVRINDAATGKPTPVRVRFSDAVGHYYAPFGRLTRFATGRGVAVGGNVLVDGEPWAYVDGNCEIDLPPGEVRVQVWKGPEYRPVNETVNLLSGKLSLRLAIERWANLREEGWYAGDIRCHFLSPRTALLEGQAEDLAVVNLLITEGRWHGDEGEQVWLANIDDFSGQQPVLEAPGHMVVVNSYNASLLGDLALLNCHRVVYPLRFDKANWTLADWCGQCHRKGGLVVWPGGVRAVELCEALANLTLGTIDGVESDAENVRNLRQLWNAGLRFALVAGSGKDSNRSALGRWRTYAKIGWGETLDYKRWIEAVRAGRTFISNGPLLWFTVEGQEAGGTVKAAKDQEWVKVRARAASLEPLASLQIVQQGAVVAEAAAKASSREVVLEAEVSGRESGWLQACCTGAKDGAALTSPVYLEKEGAPLGPTPELDSLARVLADYPALLQQMDEQNAFARAQDRARLERVFEDALKAVAERGRRAMR